MLSIAKDTFREFGAKKVPKLSAALAYYTVFSLPPLLVIVIWLSELFFGRQSVEGSIYSEMANFIGPDGAAQVQETIRNAASARGSGFAAALGIFTLLLGAGGVFGEMQDSLNHIWELKAKPRKGHGLLRLVKNRLISFSMVIVLGFLLLVALVINGVLEMVLGSGAGGPQTVLLYIANLVVSFLVTAALFAAVFKVLPDARIGWKDVISGAIATAILFMLGRFLISLYLGRSRAADAYGAAGSVILILMWVYYSAMIVYLGAALTRAFAERRGSRIYPSQYAVWVEQVEQPAGEMHEKERHKGRTK